mmetsp:Transcript_32387/g.75689  ORF Transcript_32387/g.75689 Transcript_32387/m.75689 type:complete len:242 (-) Transcript_32387:1534-2259(-)
MIPVTAGAAVSNTTVEFSGFRYHEPLAVSDPANSPAPMAPTVHIVKSIPKSMKMNRLSDFSMSETLLGGSFMFIWILVSLPVYTATPIVHFVFLSLVERCRNCPPDDMPLRGISSPKISIRALNSYSIMSGGWQWIVHLIPLTLSMSSTDWSLPSTIATCVSDLCTFSSESRSFRLVSPSRFAVSRKAVPSTLEEAMSTRSQGSIAAHPSSTVVTRTRSPTLTSHQGTILKSPVAWSSTSV